ncbi:MAG: ABC transporter permease [Candidatus Aminicenantes bacterium]|nr:MAG: ABC transporter permease [Candidatus Aminicenantes bacterium]
MKFFLDIKKFVGIIFLKKSAIYELAKRDFQAQNRNTYLGIIWGYIQPLTYIVLLVLVFTIGLRTNPGGAVPFVVYLISGMIAWQFFSGTFNSLTQVVKSHSFLVKKGDFSLSILHVAKILSSLIPHLVLLLVTMIVCWLHGILPGFYTLQLIYYLAAMFFLLLGLGWITSSTSIFIQDVSNVVTIITQFGFWFTPIIWNITRIPQKYQWIIKLNPMCYIVNGYRDSLIYKVPFWEKPFDALYFWCFTILALLIGVVVFRRLKPHFGEVI